MLTLNHERMSGAFEKWHLDGVPTPAALHHFTAPDLGDPHDHPFAFTSFVLSGGYVEEVFTNDGSGSWTSEFITREPGTSHQVDAEHIHRIVSLPTGDCWTMIVAGPHERETRFWRFNDGPVLSRAWHETEFRKGNV